MPVRRTGGRTLRAVADLGVPRVHFGTATRELLPDLLAALMSYFASGELMLDDDDLDAAR